jgi:hypothetical protein
MLVTGSQSKRYCAEYDRRILVLLEDEGVKSVFPAISTRHLKRWLRLRGAFVKKLPSFLE